MPIEDPDHPELIPAENGDPNNDGKSKETGIKAAEHNSAPHVEIPLQDTEATANIGETAFLTAWEAALATARICSKEELLQELENAKTYDEYVRWSANYYHSMINLPAVATLIEPSHPTPVRKIFFAKPIYQGLVRYLVEPNLIKEGHFEESFGWFKEDLHNRLSQNTIFDLHFTIPITPESKEKLRKIYEILGTTPPAHFWGHSYQEEIDSLEDLYKKQEQGIDIEAYLRSLTAKVYDENPSRMYALSFYRKLTEQGLKNVELFTSLKIPIIFNDNDPEKLNNFDSNNFEGLREMTSEEIETYNFIKQKSESNNYTILEDYDDILLLIRQLQNCQALTPEKFQEHFELLSEKPMEIHETINWIVFIYSKKERYKSLMDNIAQNSGAFMGYSDKEFKQLQSALDADLQKAISIGKLLPRIATNTLELLSAFSDDQIKKLEKLTSYFPKWDFVNLSYSTTAKFLSKLTESTWQAIEARLNEIPELKKLFNNIAIQDFVLLSENDWNNVKTLLKTSLIKARNLDEAGKDYEHQSATHNQGICFKFIAITNRLKNYEDPQILARDLPAFEIAPEATPTNLALQARDAFNDRRFVEVIDDILLTGDVKNRDAIVRKILALHPLYKDNLKRLRLIASMYKMDICNFDSYTNYFKIGSTDEDFATFIYAVFTHPGFPTLEAYNWAISNFPEYNFLKEINEKNFLAFLGTYADAQGADPEDVTDELEDVIAKLKDMMEKNKDKVLKYLENLRDAFLEKDGNKPLLALQLAALRATLKRRGGFQNPKFIRRTLEFICLLDHLDPTTISSLLKKFSQKGISYSKSELIDFYEKTIAIGSVENALPACLRCFDALKPNRENFSLMQSTILPLYDIVEKLSSNFKTNRTETGSYITVDYHVFFDQIATKLATEDVDTQKQTLLKVIKALNGAIQTFFELGLNLKNLPEIAAERVDEFVPFLIYLSNIHEPNDKKRAILSFFILLKILGKWDDFKAGKPVDVENYLGDKILEEVSEYLKERHQLDIFEGSLPEDKADQWIRKLQEKSTSLLLGEITSIADTLNEIEKGSSQLLDPDNFNDTEKFLLKQVEKHGAKEVLKSLVTKFRDPSFSDEITENLPTENQEKLIKSWQNIARILDSLIKFTQATKAAEIPPKLKKLEEALTPSAKVIEIFKKLGEEMTTKSGALPITDDIEHLESILHKNRENLSPEEFAEAQNYITIVKIIVMELNKIKDDLAEKYTALHHVSANSKVIGDILKNRLSEFKKLFLLEESERKINLKSSITGDLADIIPHIRQCLGCMTKECNNDTNLTFGDRNRFSIITRQAGMPDSTSLSDELVTMQKTVDQDTETEIYTFVMDNVYGKSSRDILVSNTLLLLKKLASLKKTPGGPAIDIFVTNSALLSCSTDEKYLEKRLKESFGNFKIQRTTKKVTIAQSASGDGHYEIGGGFDGRVKSGKSGIEGLKISLA